MSKWKMVPVEPTDERAASAVMTAHEAGYPMIAVSVAREVIKADIAAAPKWEPSESDVERALETFCCVGPTDKHAMRAAILVVVGGDND